MTTTPKILAFAGSRRRGSYNRAVLEVAAAGARHAGAEVTVVGLDDYPMPLFDQDIEAADGLPEGARRLKRLMVAHHALLIATPEYNSTFTPLLKNALDWCSRAEGDEPPLAAYRGKVAALVSASPGALGGLRSIYQLRSLLQNVGVTVVPRQHAVGRAHEKLGGDGFEHGSDGVALQNVGRSLAEAARRLA